MEMKGDVLLPPIEWLDFNFRTNSSMPVFFSMNDCIFAHSFIQEIHPYDEKVIFQHSKSGKKDSIKVKDFLFVLI